MINIDHVMYINLESRRDRMEKVIQELKSIGALSVATRFNAILDSNNGALGCSKSHLACIEHAKKNNWSHVMIVEDDIHFINPGVFIRQLNAALSVLSSCASASTITSTSTSSSAFDVLLIAGNNVSPVINLNCNCCVKINKCQTTTGYIVNQHYYDTLINNYKTGINFLTAYPKLHVKYAIDKFWFSLQEIHNWYLVVPLTVTQSAGYSDIEKRHTNYEILMTTINKNR